MQPLVPWIFLSKDGDDEYINRLASSAGCDPVDPRAWDYDTSSDTLVLRGIGKKSIMHRCWRENRNFLYMDSGYFGNQPNPRNPKGWKVWHRVVWNDLQHGAIMTRPADRWERHGIRMQPWRRDGRKILVAAPDEKPCEFYGIDLDQWIKDTMDTIQAHTDRPVELRQRTRDVNKLNRTKTQGFRAALEDVFAVVTFNSVAAVESVMHGVPVFALAPATAAKPVANLDLADIDSPWYPDDDLRQQWARHLAYGQFHIKELEDGTALRILQETEINRTQKGP